MDPTVVVDTGPNLLSLAIGGGGVMCFASVVWLYNLWVLIGMMRDTEAEPASGMSKAAWAVSLVAWMSGPCFFVFGLLGVILARMVTAKVYTEEMTISSNTPAGMASINFGFAFVFYIVLTIVVALST